MKKKTPPYAFIGAIVLFLICALLLWHWTKVKQDEEDARIAAQKAADDQALADAKEHQVVVQPTQTNERNVLYATQPVEPGTRMSPSFYEQKLTPVDILPDAFTDKDDITGQIAIRHIEKGDPLTPRNLGKSLPYLSQRIPIGMRALALPVFNGDYNYTGGFVVDGDKVDLLYSVNTVTSDLKVNTQTILQNVQVLYVPGPPTKSDTTDGLTPAPAPGGTIAVTFMVTPEEAEELIFLSQVKNAKFSMILRSRKDDSELKIKPFAAADYDISNLRKVQVTADKSEQRVKALEAEVAAKEKEAQGNTNETNTPPATP